MMNLFLYFYISFKKEWDDYNRLNQHRKLNHWNAFHVSWSMPQIVPKSNLGIVWGQLKKMHHVEKSPCTMLNMSIVLDFPDHTMPSSLPHDMNAKIVLLIKKSLNQQMRKAHDTYAKKYTLYRLGCIAKMKKNWLQ